MKIIATPSVGMVRARVLETMTSLTFDEARRLKAGEVIEVDDDTALEVIEYQVAVAVDAETEEV